MIGSGKLWKWKIIVIGSGKLLKMEVENGFFSLQTHTGNPTLKDNALKHTTGMIKGTFAF